MARKRPYCPTKAAWAKAEATRLRGLMATQYNRRIPSAQWRAVRLKMTGLASLAADVAKYERLAAIYEEKGV